MTQAGREVYADQLVRLKQPDPEHHLKWSRAALKVADVTKSLADYVLVTEQESSRCTVPTCEDDSQYLEAASGVYAHICGVPMEPAANSSM